MILSTLNGLQFHRWLPPHICAATSDHVGCLSPSPKTIRRCASSVGLLLRLYDVCVPPTASNGCEEWGLPKFLGVDVWKAKEQLQQPHIKILRQIAGARTSVATTILLRELDARPLVHAWWQRTMHFWNNFAESSPQSLHCQIALDDCWDAVGSKIGPLPS